MAEFGRQRDMKIEMKNKMKTDVKTAMKSEMQTDKDREELPQERYLDEQQQNDLDETESLNLGREEDFISRMEVFVSAIKADRAGMMKELKQEQASLKYIIEDTVSNVAWKLLSARMDDYASSTDDKMQQHFHQMIGYIDHSVEKLKHGIQQQMHKEKESGDHIHELNMADLKTTIVAKIVEEQRTLVSSIAEGNRQNENLLNQVIEISQRQHQSVISNLGMLSEKMSQIQESINRLASRVTSISTQSQLKETSMRGSGDSEKNRPITKAKPKPRSRRRHDSSETSDESEDLQDEDDISSTRSITSASMKSSIPSFTGAETWKVWFTRFKDIVTRQGLNDEEKLDLLLPKLRGEAGIFVYDQLGSKVRRDYRLLTRELENRFRKVENPKTYGAVFSRRTQKVTESVEAYAAELKKLYDKAHANRDSATREEDLLRRFLDGLLDPNATFHVEFVKAPKNIDEAVDEVINY